MASALSPVAGGLWSAEDTSPAAIEDALRALTAEQRVENADHALARVVNLVVVVDHGRRAEIAERLERVGRYHPSRSVVCAVDPARETLGAAVTMSCDVDPTPGSLALCRERIELDVGARHLRDLQTIVAPLVVTDLTTVLWSPHGHPEAVAALLELAQVVLLDSLDEPRLDAALARATEIAKRAYVVDLAWLRSTPWRERVAAAFDPPQARAGLDAITRVTVRHRADSRVAGLLVLGWLAARLGWDPERLVAVDGGLRGVARAGARHVELALEPVATLDAPGLAGITLELASGAATSLDRGPGGLRATSRAPTGETSAWTVLGASRGEGGILGEGVRQALLRDPTYRAALTMATAMVPA